MCRHRHVLLRASGPRGPRLRRSLHGPGSAHPLAREVRENVWGGGGGGGGCEEWGRRE